MDHSPGRREAQDVGDRQEQSHDEQVVLGEQVEAHFVRFSLAGGAHDDGTDMNFRKGRERVERCARFYLGKGAVIAVKEECVCVHTRAPRGLTQT